MPRVEQSELNQWRGVWVVCECEGGELAPSSRQLLGVARELAKRLDEHVGAVAIAAKAGPLVEQAAGIGAEHILAAEHPGFEPYRTGPWADVLCAAILQHRPSIVLLAASCIGRDLAPRVAARLETGLTADAIGLEVDDQGRFVQACPGFGGRVIVDIHCPHYRPQMVTVRPNIFPEPQPQPAEAKVEWLSVDEGIFEDPLRVLERRAVEAGEEAELLRADIVLGGGRGLQSRENFELLRQVAREIGAGVAATRAVVDDGWAPRELQVGQTGVAIKPKLYVAFGISGAIQHLAGVQGAERIVAINTDPHAPIMAAADLAIVADAPSTLLALRRRLGE